MRKNYYEDLTNGINLSDEDKKQSIFDNWQNVAANYGEQEDATIRDLLLRDLNTKQVCKFIDKDNDIIDIGCGNGFATAIYSDSAKSAIGVDYIPQFIEKANKVHCKKNLRFRVGDILDLSNIIQKYGKFDVVIAERTLINLVSWDDQKKAIKQLDSILKQNGLLILTEVTIQGHESMDILREKHGLPILEKHWNNLYIDEKAMMDYLMQSNYGHDTCYSLIHKYTFGFYSIISKVLYPCLVYPEESAFNSHINKIAAEFDPQIPINGIGHQRLFVFKKHYDLAYL